MAPRSGIGAQLGLAKETTYGTGVTVTRFLPFTREQLQVDYEWVRTAGLRAGRLVQMDELHVQTTKSVSGSIECDFLTKGMGLLLDQLHGATVTPTQIGSTAAYQQIHPIGTVEPDLKSLTIQVGRPRTDGTVQPFTYLGCKVTQAEFECERGGVLRSSWQIDGRDETTATALATATYPSGAIPFVFTGGSVKFDGSAPAALVRSAQLRIEIPYESDRYSLAATPLKALPVVNGQIQISAELELEFADLAHQTAFTSATRRQLDLQFDGPAIGGGNNFRLLFTAPKCVTVGQGPTVDGPEVVTQTVQLEIVDPGSSAPLTITYISTDTSL